MFDQLADLKNLFQNPRQWIEEKYSERQKLVIQLTPATKNSRERIFRILKESKEHTLQYVEQSQMLDNFKNVVSKYERDCQLTSNCMNCEKEKKIFELFNYVEYIFSEILPSFHDERAILCGFQLKNYHANLDSPWPFTNSEDIFVHPWLSKKIDRLLDDHRLWHRIDDSFQNFDSLCDIWHKSMQKLPANDEIFLVVKFPDRDRFKLFGIKISYLEKEKKIKLCIVCNWDYDQFATFQNYYTSEIVSPTEHWSRNLVGSYPNRICIGEHFFLNPAGETIINFDGYLTDYYKLVDVKKLSSIFTTNLQAHVAIFQSFLSSTK